MIQNARETMRNRSACKQAANQLGPGPLPGGGDNSASGVPSYGARAASNFWGVSSSRSGTGSMVEKVLGHGDIGWGQDMSQTSEHARDYGELLTLGVRWDRAGYMEGGGAGGAEGTHALPRRDSIR